MEIASVSAERSGSVSPNIAPERSALFASSSDQQTEEAARVAARDDARSGERVAASSEDERGRNVDIRA
ncbi:MAG: hypothetical protein KC466_02760 [Myxococcales bacterium]|nr:hypothetical protein [Myxococcales bacterium]